MDSDESAVQRVEKPTSNERYRSTTTSNAEISLLEKRPPPTGDLSFSRLRDTAQQRSRTLSHRNEQPPHLSNRQLRHEVDFHEPGGLKSTNHFRSTSQAPNNISQPPLDTEVSGGRHPKPSASNRPVALSAESPRSGVSIDQPRTPLPRRATEYNEKTLQEDRARRDGIFPCHHSTAPVASASVKARRSISLDDDSHHGKPLRTARTGSPPAKMDEELSPDRRSTRDSSVTQNQVDLKDKVGRASEANDEGSPRGAKANIITEISYDGPRDLIFMYPPGERGNIRVTTEERERLKQHKYLNDSLIDFYLKLLEVDLRRRPPPLNFATKFFSSFFFGVLRRVKADTPKRKKSAIKSPSIDYSGVKNWTKGFDIFATDFVIVPICDSFHWSLIIVANLRNLEKTLQKQKAELKQDEKERDQVNDPGRPKIIYLDSMDPDRGADLAIPIRHYLVEEWLVRKKGCDSDDCDNERTDTIKAFRKAIPLLKPNVPVQNNEYDCGLYVLNNLSMFLNNTESFMAKMLHGDLDMRMAYSSGDITKLRKNMTFLMDLFEEEWNRRQGTSAQAPKTNRPKQQNEGGTRKKTPPSEEEDFEEAAKDIIDVASAAGEDTEKDVYLERKRVTNEAALPPPEIEEINLETNTRFGCPANSRQEGCGNRGEPASNSDDVHGLVVHVSEITNTVAPAAHAPHKSDRDSAVSITSSSVHSVGSRDEEEPAMMECDVDCVEVKDNRDSDMRLTGRRDMATRNEIVQAVDTGNQQNDSLMGDSDLLEVEAASTKKISDADVMDTGSNSEAMELDRSNPVNDVEGTGMLKVVGNIGLRDYQQRLAPAHMAQRGNSAPLSEEEEDEIIDGGNGNDMEENYHPGNGHDMEDFCEPVQNSTSGRRKKRIVVARPGGLPGRPLLGYAMEQVSVGEDTHPRRERSRTVRRCPERGPRTGRKGV